MEVNTGTVDIPLPPVGSKIVSGSELSYIAAVLEAIKGKLPPKLEANQWCLSILAYAKLVQGVNQLPNDDGSDGVDPRLSKLEGQLQEMAWSLNHIRVAFAPLDWKFEEMCEAAWSQLFNRLSAAMNKLDAIPCLDVDDVFWVQTKGMAVRHRELEAEARGQPKAAAGKRAAGNGDARSAQEANKAPKLESTKKFSRADRGVAAGGSKPHAESKQVAIAAGRNGKGAPHMCIAFKDGKCTKNERCNDFHLCWWCWSKAEKPYDEAGHQYEDCPDKLKFSKDPPSFSAKK